MSEVKTIGSKEVKTDEQKQTIQKRNRLKGELDRESTCAKFAYVPETRERSYEITYYNLDVIISVVYHANSVKKSGRFGAAKIGK